MKHITYAKKYRIEPNGIVHGQRGVLSARNVGYHANGSSYQQVALYADRKRINKYIHVLVAEAYLDGYDAAIHQVNHIDGNKANNQLVNLELINPSENMKHAADAGLLGTHLGKHNPNPKYTKRLTRMQQERATTIPKGSTLK
jgi:hypothetical protein